MNTITACPNCQQPLKIDAKNSGYRVRCTNCRTAVQLPDPFHQIAAPRPRASGLIWAIAALLAIQTASLGIQGKMTWDYLQARRQLQRAVDAGLPVPTLPDLGSSYSIEPPPE